jgi:hypothetical protein
MPITGECHGVHEGRDVASKGSNPLGEPVETKARPGSPDNSGADTQMNAIASPQGATESEVPSRIKSAQCLIIAGAVGLLAFGVYLWQLSVPEFISFYDTGVYTAAAEHFVSGALPYKDFTFVNPPGIILLLSPIGLIARIFGSHDGLIVGRIFTSLATALNASLLALLVRHRGRVAMIIAGVGLALLPITFFVSSDVKLDPYSICFVLLGSIVIFSIHNDEGSTSSRTLVIGGILFGVAAVIKLWAFFPFLALFVCLVPRYRKRVLLFVSGAAAGFIVPSLPFFIAAPGNFISQVFTVQLHQKIDPAMSPGVLWRLVALSGTQDTSIAPTYRGVEIILVAFVVVVALAFRRRIENQTIDVFLVFALVITACGLLAAPAFQTYYGYFAAPFLVGVVAVSLSRLARPLHALMRKVQLSHVSRLLVSSVAALAGVGLIFALTLYVTTFFTNYAWYSGVYGPYLGVIDQYIPPGACVVYNYVIYGVYSNRLESSDAKCPNVVDPYGMWQSWGNHTIAPSPIFVAQWKSYFEAAQYVVFNQPNNQYVPWNKGLTNWFASNYRLLYGNNHVFIYVNRTNPVANASAIARVASKRT